jgi:hypothetical protein
MDPIFSAAIEHIRVMDGRITKQEDAIERLRMLREDASDAERRLRLLRAALDEMRIQLAQLTPTAEQVAAIKAAINNLWMSERPQPTSSRRVGRMAAGLGLSSQVADTNGNAHAGDSGACSASNFFARTVCLPPAAGNLPCGGELVPLLRGRDTPLPISDG